ncbi:matrix metallopeptidase 19 [Arthrobotrys megalospora]
MMQNPTSDDVIRESRPAIRTITKHLTCFNCFSADWDARMKSGLHDEVDDYAELCTGIAKFQNSVGLIPATGVFDRLTAQRLKESHCHNHSCHDDYIKLGGNGRDNTIKYCFERYSDGVPVSDVRKAFDNAFQQWSAHCLLPYTFEEAAPHHHWVDIKIRWAWGYDDPNSDSSTTSFECEDEDMKKKQEWKDDFVRVSYWSYDLGVARVDICFNEEKVYTMPILQEIALHHVGHILGIGHSDVKDAVMWAGYGNTTLHKDDIRAIRAKWQPELGRWHRILDSQPGMVKQIVAAPGNRFFRRDIDGSVWQYNCNVDGTWGPIKGIGHLGIVAQQIDANSHYLFLLNEYGEIFRCGKDSDLHCIELASNHRKTIRAVRDGKEVYILQGEYWVSVYRGELYQGKWEILGGNPSTDGGIDMTANDKQVFFSHMTGRIYVANKVGQPCRLIHIACKTKQLVGAGSWLYRLDESGTLFEWYGEGIEWGVLDDNKQNAKIAAAGSYLWVYSEDGRIRYTIRKSKALGNQPVEWIELAKLHTDTVLQLSAAESSLYSLDGNGDIHQLTMELEHSSDHKAPEA